MPFRILSALLVLVCITVVSAQDNGQKKNQRPTSNTPTLASERTAGTPVYFYTFSNPKFFTSSVKIEHDENGLGTISFRKNKLDDEFVRPLVLSEVTTVRLKEHWDNLKFLNSNENYQSELDYPHLGTMNLRKHLAGKERSAEFNWTDNPDAKALTHEYKKIGYQYVWMFDLEVAMRNQQLETPRIMKQIDSYLRRNEISDPEDLFPYLEKLGNDERLPLIARNHAKRIAESIAKTRKKDR